MSQKYFSVVIIIMILFILVGCSLPFSKSSITPNSVPTLPVITESISNATEVVPNIDVLATDIVKDSSDNPCYNVFYPLAPGNQWVYKLKNEESAVVTPEPGDSTGQIGVTVASVEGNQAKLDALEVSSGVITQTTVECDNGSIMNFPMLTMSLIFGDQASGAAEVEYKQGVFVPSEIELAENDWVDSWSGDYILKANFVAQDDEDQITFTISDSPMKLVWQTQGIHEAIEVPAGNYPNAIRVERDTEMNISMSLASTGENLKIDGILKFSTILWYEPYVGLLKEEIHSANVSYRGMTFPVVVSGGLELLEFRPAK